MAEVVMDASALVDLLLGKEMGLAVRDRITGHRIHAPAHIDSEVLSAFGRLHRAGEVDSDQVDLMLRELTNAVIQRHALDALVVGAWNRRGQLRLADALYVELAASLSTPLITTDGRLRTAPWAEVISTELDTPGS
jgi:predicted nucleic acid-binding protein